MMTNVYKQAGVDVEKGYEAVERMKKHIQKTNRPEVMGGIGALLVCLNSRPFSIKNLYSFREQTELVRN